MEFLFGCDDGLFAEFGEAGLDSVFDACFSLHGGGNRGREVLRYENGDECCEVESAFQGLMFECSGAHREACVNSEQQLSVQRKGKELPI